ncbi:MAG TPA: efflux RND transporter periplasmic adaptor subunit [Longimicrobiaceae bacterium]|nr:efflux RND transporter periplasmic adaptor subunit [Longimicrobiaceae bacterium]
MARTLGIAADDPAGGGAAPWARRWRPALRALLVLAIVAAAAILWRTTRPASAIHYETAPARLGSLDVTVTATGALEPVNLVEVGSEVSGPIRRVLVDFNDPVRRGEVLAELDTERLRARLAEAEASLRGARATVAQALATEVEATGQARRATALAAAGALSRQELESAVAAAERAQAAVEAARAQATVARAELNAARTDLARAVIRSPVNGIVIERRVEPGQTVAAAFQIPVLFTIADDLSKMELHADVDEADVGRVRAGDPASFSVDAYPERRFPARVASLRHAPRVVQGVVTYGAVLGVDNRERLLRPGMTATVVIATDHRERALLVPNAALRYLPPTGVQQEPLPAGRHRVWTLREGSPAPLIVTTGLTDGRVTEILSGALRPGTPLVIGSGDGR